MEIWYDGQKRAVRSRAFSIDTQTHNRQPTILVGRNGSGKTLAASVLRKTRKMLLEHGGDFAGGFADWLAFVRGVGIDSLGVQIPMFLDAFEFDDDDASIPDCLFQEPNEEENRMEIDLEYPAYEGVQMSNNRRWETSLMACSLNAHCILKFERLDDKAPCLTGQIQIVGSLTQDVDLVDQGGVELEEYHVHTKFMAPVHDLFSLSVEDDSSITDIVELFITEIGNSASRIEWDTYGTVKLALGKMHHRLHEEVGIMPAWVPMLQSQKNGGDLCSGIGEEMFLINFPQVYTVKTERRWSEEEWKSLDHPLLQAVLNLKQILYEKYAYDGGLADVSDLFHHKPLEETEHSRLREKYVGPIDEIEKFLIVGECIPVFGDGKGEMDAQVRRSVTLPVPEGVPLNRYAPPIRLPWPEIGEWYQFADSVIESLVYGTYGRYFRVAAKQGQARGAWFFTDDEDGVNGFLHVYLLWKYLFNLLNNITQLARTRTMLALVDFFVTEVDDSPTLLDILGATNSENIPSGYGQLFSLFTAISDAAEAAGGRSNVVLFLDEPELSLHIDWQARLLERMLGLMKDLRPYSLGLLVATHSPGIIQDHLDSVVDFSLSDVTEGD